MKRFSLIQTRNPIMIKSIDLRDDHVSLWSNEDKNYFWIAYTLNDKKDSLYGFRNIQMAELNFTNLINKHFKGAM